MDDKSQQLTFPFYASLDDFSLIAFVERPTAFSISFDGNSIETECALKTDRFILYSNREEPKEFGLFDTSGISDAISGCFSKENAKRKLLVPTHPSIKQEVRRQLRRLHLCVPLAIKRVSAAVARSTNGSRIVPNHPDILRIYESRKLVDDICTYTPAAFALAWLPELARGFFAQQSSQGKARRILPNFIAITRADSDKRLGEEPATIGEEIPDLFQAFKRWGLLYSASGRSHVHLVDTISNCKICDPDLLLALQSITLPRKISDEVELRFLLEALRAEFLFSGAPDLVRIASYTRRSEIEKALDRLSRTLGVVEDARRPSSITFLAAFCARYPEAHSGRLSGLVTKALAWNKKRLKELIEKYGGESAEATTPPIPLPNVQGVTFLSSLGNLIREGREQSLCLEGEDSINDFLNGDRYFFSVGISGSRATASVSAQGELGEIVGYANDKVSSPATRYAHQILARWAKKLELQLSRG